MRVDGNLDLLWEWCRQEIMTPGRVIWVGPSGVSARDSLDAPSTGEIDVESNPQPPGWYWAAYPALSPYYPIPTVSPEWMDAWSMQDIHGFWW